MTKFTKSIIAGAVILGGVIAIASTQNEKRYSTVQAVAQKPTNVDISKYAPKLETKAYAGEASSVNLTDANTAVFRDEVNAQSIAKLQREILNKATKLHGKPLYLVLDTPGGDINAGYDLIDMIQGMNLNVKTITQFSASMGAYIAESLGERLVTPHGTYMFHRAAVDGVGGQVPGEFLTRAGYLLNLVTVMEKQNAARLGISFDEYTKLVKDEYWVTGEEAVKQGVADRVVTISCGEGLQGEHTEVVRIFIFELAVTYSNCPAIRGPLNVEMLKGSGNAKDDRIVIQDFIYKRNKTKGSRLN